MSNKKKFVLCIIGILFIIVVLFAMQHILVYSIRDNHINRDIYILSTKGSYEYSPTEKDNFVVANSEKIYICFADKVYEYVDDDNLNLFIKCEAKPTHMAVTDRYLIYSVTEFYTCRVDLESGHREYLLKDMEVGGIFVVDDDYFINVTGIYVGGDYNSANKMYLFEGESTSAIEIPLEGQEKCEDKSLAGYDEVLKYTYGEYDVYIGANPGRTSSAYKAVVDNGNINSFAREGVFFLDGKVISFFGGKYNIGQNHNELYSIEQGNIGVFGCMSSVYNDRIYSVVQVGKGYTAGAPNPASVKYDVLLEISPDGHEDILYKTTKKQRIVGYDIENNKVIVYQNNGNVYAIDLNDNEKTRLMKLGKADTSLYFEWINDRLFVFEEYEYNKFKLVGSSIIATE